MAVAIKGVPGQTHILAHIAASSYYPLEAPLVTVRNDKLPAHVRLALTTTLNLHARESVGEPVRGIKEEEKRGEGM